MGRSFLMLVFACLLGIAASAGPLLAQEEAHEKVPVSTARANAKGNELVRKGEFGEAAEVYRDEALKRPENGILQRNLAGALARSQQMEEGLAAYGQALRFAETPREKATALYDLGNSLALAGQLQPALETYAQAMFLAPDDLDIKHNFEYLMKMMQDQQQEQEQQSEQDEEERENQEQGDQSDQEQQSQESEDEAQQTPQPQQSDTPEQQQQEQQMPQSETETMDPEDAQRLLDALLEEEKELRAERNQQQQLQYKNVEKDW